MTTTFPLDLQADLYVGNAWTSATSLVYQRDGSAPPVSIRRGRSDEMTKQPTASSSAFEVNNRGGQFSPFNPLGPWYGSLGANTPARLSIPALGNYLRLEAGVQARAYVNDVAALHITGSIEMRIALDLSDWQGCTLACKWDNGGCWVWSLNDDGTLSFRWADSGATQHVVTSGVPVPLWRGTAALRVTMDATTGSVAFYQAAAIDGTYTQVGVTASGTGGSATSIFSSTGSALAVGYSFNVNPGLQMYGRVAEYRLYSGIGGTVVADTVMSGVAAGSTTWTDSAGLAWHLAGGAEVSSRDYRFHGEIAELPPVWDSTGNDQSVKVTASGPLRRMGQGQAPAQSPIRRAIATQAGTLAPVAYWPCEDAAGATAFGSATGGALMQFDGSPNLASDSTFACSAPLPALNGSRWRGRVGTYSGSGSIVVRWPLKVGTLPSAKQPLVRLVTTGTASTVTFSVDNSGFGYLVGTTAAGSTVFSDGPFFALSSSSFSGTPGWMSVELRPSGGTVTVGLVMLTPAGTVAYQLVTDSFSGSVGNVTDVYVNPSAAFGDTVLGHMSVQSDWVSMFSLQQPLDAWDGELAAARFARVCGEEGIACRIVGSPAYSAAMGQQPVDTVVNILQQVEDADRGQWSETRQVLGFQYRTLASMCNQAARVTIDYSQAQLGGTTGGSDTGLRPTLDDARLRNDWQVTRGSSGGSGQGMTYQYQLADGSPLSVTKAGDYSDSLTANVEYDSQVPNLAGWLTSVGTVNDYRWPSIPFNLRRPAIQNAGLYYPLLSLDIGDYLQLTSMPNVILYNPVRQLAWGLTESLGGMHHALEIDGVPEAPYEVIALDDPVRGRVDTDGSQLSGAVSSGAVTLDVISGLGPQWTTAAADMPFDISLGGERCTVTAVGAGPAGTRVGAFLDATALGQSTWAPAYTAWQSVTGLTLGCARWYAGGSPGWGTSLAAMAAAGVRILLDVTPAYNPPSSAALAQIVSVLQSAQAAGADVRVSLWHEPYYGGLSAAQFQAAWAYYGPTIRQYYPLWAVFADNDTVQSAGYYPPPGTYDGLAADDYATSLTNLNNVAAVADRYGVPVGLWEFNGPDDLGLIDSGTASPVSGITLAQSQAYFTAVQAFFQARLNAGKLNGDICFFSAGGEPGSGTGTGNFLGTSLGQNGGFEGGKGNWLAGALCAVAQTAAQAHSGTGSLAVTCSGGGTSTVLSCGSGSIATQGLPVAAGQPAIATAWVRAAATGRNTFIGLQWFTSAGASISTTNGTTVADTTTGWTFISVNGTAPATAAYARIVVSVGSALAGEVHYIDDPQIGTLPSGSTDHTGPVQYPWDYRISSLAAIQAALDGTSPQQAMTVTRSVNGVVMPHNSGTDVRLWFPPILALT